MKNTKTQVGQPLSTAMVRAAAYAAAFSLAAAGAGCGDDDATSTTDGGSTARDSGGTFVSDSGSSFSDGGSTTTDSGTSSDGGASCGDLSLSGDKVVISEIVLEEYIEFYNPTDSPVDLRADGYVLCLRPMYPPVSGTVPAGGYFSIDWPFRDGATSAAGGEIALYDGSPNPGSGDGTFEDDSLIVDYVCWGGGKGGPDRNPVATSAGIWPESGCAGALDETNESIQRLPSTDGESPASYDVTSAPVRCE